MAARPRQLFVDAPTVTLAGWDYGNAAARGAGVANSGADSAETTGGGFQNSRAGLTDREVSVEGVKANTQGNRGANNSIGGERANSNTLNPDQSSRGESFGNH